MADEKKTSNIPEISAEDYAQMVYVDGDSLVIDLSNVQELKFENIPKGIYAAEVDQVDFVKESKSSGSPMLEFTFRITDGEYSNRKLKFWTSFSPKALSGSKTALLRLDPELFNGPFNPAEVAETGKLLQKKVRIKVDVQDYQGRDTNRISYLLPPGEAGGEGGGFFKAA